MHSHQHLSASISIANFVRGLTDIVECIFTPNMLLLLHFVQADRFNFYNMDSSERSRWLDDGLHLTEMAYNTLGRQIARVIGEDYGKRR